jgi:phage baseplate assembly protein W
MASTKDFNILFQKVTTTANLVDFAMVTDFNMYVQQIQNVCNTQKGEHLNHNFGCNLFEYLFDRQANKHIIETIVASSIQTCIPSLTNVVAYLIYSDDQLMRFNIEFYIRDGIKNQNATCTIEVNL